MGEKKKGSVIGKEKNTGLDKRERSDYRTSELFFLGWFVGSVRAFADIQPIFNRSKCPMMNSNREREREEEKHLSGAVLIRVR